MPRARIKPSKASSAWAVIVGVIALFVLLGVFLPAMQDFNRKGNNDLPPELGGPQPSLGPEGGFLAIMVILVLVGIGFSAFNLLSERGVAEYEVDIDGGASGPEVDVDMDEFDAKLVHFADSSVMEPEPAGAPSRPVAAAAPETSHAASASDFDSRLRKLTKLKEDGLITAEEFNRKRAEIMSEPW